MQMSGLGSVSPLGRAVISGTSYIVTGPTDNASWNAIPTTQTRFGNYKTITVSQRDSFKTQGFAFTSPDLSGGGFGSAITGAVSTALAPVAKVTQAVTAPVVNVAQTAVSQVSKVANPLALVVAPLGLASTATVAGPSVTSKVATAASALGTNMVNSTISVAKMPVDILTGKESLTLSNVAKMATAPLGLATTAGAGGPEVTQKVGNAIGAAAVIGTAAYALAGGFAAPSATSAPTTAAAAPATTGAATGAVTTGAATGAASPASTLLTSIVTGVKTAAGAVTAAQQLEAQKAVSELKASIPITTPPATPAVSEQPMSSQQWATILGSPAVLAALAAAVFLL